MMLPADCCDKWAYQCPQSTGTRQLYRTVRGENEEEGYENKEKGSITDNIMLEMDFTQFAFVSLLE